MTQSQPMLSYGPAARSRGRWAVVLIAGAATTVLTLLVSWAVEQATGGKFLLMGLYAAGIVPVGALGVGMAAASGYALGALWTGVRIRGALLAAVLGITLVSYFGLHYAAFLALGPMVHKGTGAPLTFAEYFDLETRSLRFRFGHGGTGDAGFDLGGFGYAVRTLELAAFTLAAVVTPLMLRNRRYCDRCERYHQVMTLAVVPAAVKSKKGINQADPLLKQQNDATAQQADAVVNRLADAVAAGDGDDFRQQVDRLAIGTKAARGVPRRVEVRLTRCRGCGQGVVEPTLVTVLGQNNVSRKPLWTAEVEPTFTDAVRPR